MLQQYDQYSDEALWMLYCEGQPAAMDALALRMINAVQPLVKKLERWTQDNHCYIDDIQGIASEAIMTAFASYNPTLGYPLRRYVCWRVRYIFGSSLSKQIPKLDDSALSLDALATEENNSTTVGDFIQSQEDIEEYIIRQHDHAALRQILRSLPVLAQRVLILRYHYELADEEISHILGLSPSRVYQLRKAACAELRQRQRDEASQ